MEEAQLNGKIRVLVASTDVHVRKLLASALACDRRFEVVAQATDGGAVVTCDAGFDAAVVDVAISGLGILGVMSGLNGCSPRPVVIVVSRTVAVYLEHACLAEGAADYVVLPDDLPLVPERVFRAVQAAKLPVGTE